MRATDVTQECPPDWLKPRRSGRKWHRYDTVIGVDGEGITDRDDPYLEERSEIEVELWAAIEDRQALRDTVAATRWDDEETGSVRDSRETILYSLPVLRRTGSIEAARDAIEVRKQLNRDIRARNTQIRALRSELASVPRAPRHDYTLLAASTGDLVEGRSLGTKRCLDFLLSLNPRALVCGFSFDYDVNMLLKDLPLETLRELVERGFTRWGPYRLRWKPHKEFGVSRPDLHLKTTVWDVFGFFQCSFVKALHSWKIASPDEVTAIEEMKAKRGVFQRQDKAQVRDYCLLECRLLQVMVEKLLECTRDVGLSLKRYDGAGAMGAALLDKYGVKARVAEPPTHEARRVVLHAYYGGRFESSQIGFVGHGYQYDINSAYPAEATALPCLVCGYWYHSRSLPVGRERGACRSLHHVRWSLPVVPDWPVWGPFPWRSARGAICYPVAGEGWYWDVEVAAASDLISRYGGELEVLGGWCYVTECEHLPFGWIPDLYRQRLELQREGNFGEKALKLGLNSVYGKTAQSVGHKDRRPPYQSFAWAGMITAGCRARILEAVAADPSGVVSIATDGVISVRELQNLSVGDGLGKWEREAVTEVFLAQNGVYRFFDSEGKEVKKNRGFSATEFDFDAIAAEFARSGVHTEWNCTVTRFIGARSSLKRTVPLADWRRWVAVPKSVSLMPRNRLVGSVVGIAGGDQTEKTYAWMLREDQVMSSPYVPKMTWEDGLTSDQMLDVEQPA